jgi:hypothetical protein
MTIILPKVLECRLDELKREVFYRDSHSKMLCDLVALGIEKLDSQERGQHHE